jgi:hypothetical protein
MVLIVGFIYFIHTQPPIHEIKTDPEFLTDAWDMFNRYKEFLNLIPENNRYDRFITFMTKEAMILARSKGLIEGTPEFEQYVKAAIEKIAPDYEPVF